MKAKAIMTRKVVTVKKDCTIYGLIKLLKKNSITGAPVVDENGCLIGIVSVKDLLYAIEDLVKTHLSIEEIKEIRGACNWVEGFMTKDVITVDENEEVSRVFKLMVDHHIHRVPVMKGELIAGIISTSDAHRAIIKYINRE